MEKIKNLDLRSENRNLTKISNLKNVLGHSFASIPGITITAATAMQIAAVYACVRILAETIACLPLILYRRLPGGGKERAVDHPLYHILHNSFNSRLTSYEAREMMQGHLGLRGNSYAYIRRVGGHIQSITPLHPDACGIDFQRSTVNKLMYVYDGVNGKFDIPEENMLHLRGLSGDGYYGYSPLKIAKESFGLTKAMEEYASRFFTNNASPSGVLEHPDQLSQNAMENIQKSWMETQGGLANAHKPAILEEGMSWKQIGISAEDAQLLEERKFQNTEIARIFRVPNHLINDLEKSSFSNIEQQSLEFVIYSMTPWFIRHEQRYEKSLLTEKEQKEYCIEHLVAGLLRGDIKTRYEAYAIGRTNGWLNGDEIRELENMNPMPDGQGKIYYMPLNMIDAKQAAQIPAPEKKSLSETRAIPMQERRSIVARDRIAHQYFRLFEKSAQKIVNREGLAIKRKLGNREDFQTWLAAFYRDFPEFIKREIGPLFRSFAEAVRDSSVEEIGVEPDGFSKFVSDYVVRYTERHVSSSHGQIFALLEEGEDAIQTRVDEWQETRPGKIATNETTRMSNAVFQMVAFSAGLPTYWRIRGKETCEWCKKLDGMMVNPGETFVNDGDEFKNSAGETFKIRGTKAHAPLHQGCDCYLSVR